VSTVALSSFPRPSLSSRCGEYVEGVEQDWRQVDPREARVGGFNTLTRLSFFTRQWLARFSSVMRGERIRSAYHDSPARMRIDGSRL